MPRTISPDAVVMDDQRLGSKHRQEAVIMDAEWTEGVAEVSLAEVLPKARFVGCDDVVAVRCTADAEACRPGDVFVAHSSGAGDGHEDVAQAIAQGAAAVVAERMVPTQGVPLCLVPDSSWALARLAHACAGDPARALKIVAVTGTSGKTTTAWLTASVLAEAGLRVGVLSDLGCLDADGTLPERADLGRPDVLAGWLRRLAASGCTHAVVEVSSRMLAGHALAGVECGTVVVTSLAAAHADAHGTSAAYRAITGRILKSLAPGGCLVVNADDPRVQRLGRRHSGPTITAALSARADVSAMPVERSLHGQTVLVSAGGHAAAITVEPPTASFVRDALFAAAVGLRFRIPLERVSRGIEAADNVPGRLQRIDRGQSAAVFVDQATTGHALASTLSSLRRLTPGRLLLVAEEEAASRIDSSLRFAARASRWCNDTLVVPATVLAEDADAEALAAYARLDRMLSRAREGDCVLVLGRPPASGGDPFDPGDPAAVGTLATLVDGWLQVVHPPTWGRRRAA
jgi:UDP-N-acetylmuramoyl-L-alanyl-D-glutamate--2,6-diaminopimelate ligase